MPHLELSPHRQDRTKIVQFRIRPGHRGSSSDNSFSFPVKVVNDNLVRQWSLRVSLWSSVIVFGVGRKKCQIELVCKCMSCAKCT